jgi:voltage-dependent anion channel protein 2
MNKVFSTAGWMNTPPKYGDLGKECRDLLEKDFPFDVKKVEINTTAPNTVTFAVTGSQDSKTGLYSTELKTKYSHVESGLSLTEKWTNDNKISADVESSNSFVPGLTLKVETQYFPQKSQNSIKVLSGYIQEFVNANTAIDAFKGPYATADLTVGANGIFVGGEMGYNTKNATIDKYALGAAYYHPDYNIVVQAKNMLNVFTTSYYHRVSPTLAAGCSATWDRDRLAADSNHKVFFEFGTHMKLQGGAAAKIKLDSIGRITASYIQYLTPNVIGTLAAHVDTKKTDKDACKIGFNLSFNA